jgi:hypothetical protein
MGRKTSTGGVGGAMNPFKLAQPVSPSRNDFGASPRPEIEDEEELEQEEEALKVPSKQLEEVLLSRPEEKV